MRKRWVFFFFVWRTCIEHGCPRGFLFQWALILIHFLCYERGGGEYTCLSCNLRQLPCPNLPCLWLHKYRGSHGRKKQFLRRYWKLLFVASRSNSPQIILHVQLPYAKGEPSGILQFLTPAFYFCSRKFLQNHLVPCEEKNQSSQIVKYFECYLLCKSRCRP